MSEKSTEEIERLIDFYEGIHKKLFFKVHELEAEVARTKTERDFAQAEIDKLKHQRGY